MFEGAARVAWEIWTEEESIAACVRVFDSSSIFEFVVQNLLDGFPGSVWWVVDSSASVVIVDGSLSGCLGSYGAALSRKA